MTNKDGEIVMYILVNSDLKMSTGKIASQVAHSALKTSVKGFRELLGARDGIISCGGDWFKEWWNGSYTKIVLKSDTTTMEKMIKERPDLCAWTRDEGRTQIQGNSLTAIAVTPMPKELVCRIFPEIKDMKLL